MPNVNVTMLQTRRGENGTQWTQGSTYSATEEFARFLITSNLATGTLPNNARSAVPGDGNATAEGMTVTVGAFSAAGFTFSGGSITLPADGTWFVGMELWSGRLRVLPRNLHRGIVYVCRCVVVAGAVTLTQMAPVMPATRIPRTLSAIKTGRQIRAMVLGSSLTEYYQIDGNDWVSMLFSPGGELSTRPYMVSYAITPTFGGLGSSPINYHAALGGIAMQHDGVGVAGVGMPSALRADAAGMGRSQVLQGVDLVVIGPVANTLTDWWDASLALVRQAQRAGAEVILLTDEATGPSTDYAAMSVAPWYVDGPRIADLADATGAELADTAAYMFEAHIRAGGVGIYRDSVHQSMGAPTGPAAVLPANGMECWARAIRSLFTTTSTAPAMSSAVTQTFEDGTTQGWLVGNAGTVANGGGVLQITVPSSNNIARLPLGAFVVGDTVKVRARLQTTGGISSIQMSMGKIGVGSYSNSVTVNNFSGSLFAEITLTISAATADGQLLWWINTSGAGTVTADDLTYTITRTVRPAETVVDTVPGRAVDSRAGALAMSAGSANAVGDVAIILPAQEAMLRAAHANAGTLGASPNGAGSFARRVSPVVGASADLLTLGVGKQFALSHQLALSYGLVYYMASGDSAVSLSVSAGGSTIKTLTLPALGVSREFYSALLTPAEAAAAGNPQSLLVTVTAGTLKLAAGAIMTPDVDYIAADDLTFGGTWGRETSAAGLPGRWSDTAGDTASTRASGRAWWVLSGTSGAQPVDIAAGLSQSLAVAVSGSNVTRLLGGSRGDRHTLRATAAGAGSAGNRALAVAGAMVVRDR
jgi:hypothetical protein